MGRDEERAAFVAEAERQSKMIVDAGEDWDLQAWMDEVAAPLPEEPEGLWWHDPGNIDGDAGED